MASSGSTWRRDTLLVPIAVGVVVGLIVWAAGYFLPKVFEKGKRISYTIDGPTAYVNPGVANGVKITIAGVETPNIYAYKVRVWNSGSVPLSALPVRFSFETTTPTFTVFNVTHETTPKREFGKIEEIGSDAFSKRFVYELLNPKDEDLVTFLTNISAKLTVFAKAPNLSAEPVEAKIQNRKWVDYVKVVSLLMVLLSSVGATFAMAGLWRLRLDKRFSLIDSFAEDVAKQFLILMAETGHDMSPIWHEYTLEDGLHRGAGGQFDFEKFRDQFGTAGFVRLAPDGHSLSLTEDGRKFADWLIAKGQKVDYFKTSFGGWGTPKLGGVAELWRKERAAQQSAAQKDLPPSAPG
jgi:hypothetical protein